MITVVLGGHGESQGLLSEDLAGFSPEGEGARRAAFQGCTCQFLQTY